MSFIVLRNNLKEALLITERGLGENANLPILKSLSFKINKEGVFISSTNLEIGITTNCSAKIINEDKFLIQSNIISSLIANIPSERLDIKKINNLLEVKSDNYEATIPILSPEDFPIIPEIENKNKYLEINGNIFTEALTQVVQAVQFSEIRPEISGVYLNFDLEIITLVGTDSFRLAEKKIKNTNFKTNYEEGFKCIIPLKTIQECIRIFKKNEVIKLYFDENQFLIKNNQTKLISRLIEGNFPDYKAIIPKGFETEIEVDRNEFINALKFVGSSNQLINEVKIIVHEEKKFFEIQSTERSSGKFKTIIPAKIKGKNNEIIFNWRYIIDGVKNIQNNTITFILNSNTKPALISLEDSLYLYLLMPIKQ
ncbi:MAG: DNA polymerase III subunit beta [bacterium]|nr:DNA polymerase III subunit beta [bacterium]